MNEPPFIIDGARVLAYAHLDPAAGPARRATAVASGVPLQGLTSLIIAENLADGAIFLLYCNADWDTLAAELHPDRGAAAKTAEAALPGIASRWAAYRELTPAELGEIETTRTFLHDLAREFPNDP